jgi:dienelactone hydrolase
MKTKLLALALSPFVFAMGCSQEDLLPAGFSADGQVAGPVAVYSPTIAQMPLPIDLFFSGTTDLTLNLPSSSPPAQAVNSMDGWSTVAPITAKFNTAVIPATLIAGVTVRMFRICVNPFSTKPTGAITELKAGTDYSVGISNTGTDFAPAARTLVIKPLKALAPKFDATSLASCPAGAQGDLNRGNGYLVVLTHGTTPVAAGGTRVEITSAAGVKVGPSDFFKIAKGTKCLFRSPGDSTTDCPVVDAGDSGNPGTTPAGVEAGFANTAVASQVKTETLRRLTNGHQTIAVGVSGQVAMGFGPNAPATIDPADIILAWQFSPQSIGNVIQAVNGTFTQAQATTPQNPTLTDTNHDTGHADLINADVPTAGEVFTGTVSLPYYLTPPDASNPTAFLTEHWESEPNPIFDNTTNLTFANPLPAKVSDYPVPVFSVVPKAALASPATPVPVAIVQHGIGSNRTNIVALAERLAQSGIATIAIDVPLHGLNNSGNAFFAATERNFGALNSGVQSSQAFLNVGNLEVARDNTRQGIADLLALEELIGSMSLSSGTGASQVTLTFDTNKIYFVGHSLGGIIGTTFLANSDKVKAATLAMAGGGIAKLLDASLAFGGSIADGLRAQGVVEGTKTYEDYLVLTQTVVDSSDPLNSAANLAATSIPIHFIEISGGALMGQNPSDIVVPNDSFAVSPFNSNIPELGLGGSRPLIDGLVLDRVDGATAAIIADTPVRTAVQFSSGFHSSILLPQDANPPNGTGINACVTFNEIGDQIAGFFSSDGATLTIGNGTHPRCP